MRGRAGVGQVVSMFALPLVRSKFESRWGLFVGSLKHSGNFIFNQSFGAQLSVRLEDEFLISLNAAAAVLQGQVPIHRFQSILGLELLSLTHTLSLSHRHSLYLS